MISTHATAYDELESMADGTFNASEFVGDQLVETPDQDTTRIYIQNLNGLCWNKEGGRWPYVCDAMATIQADIACFSEINTDTNQYPIRTKMESICRRHFQENCLIMSSSTITTSTSHYKPGGTAIMARDAITTRVKSHSRDRMGRWTLVIDLSDVISV